MLIFDDQQRLVSSTGTTTAARPAAGPVLNPLQTFYDGPYPSDAIIAISTNWIKSTAGDPYVNNQISSLGYAQGNVWQIPIWGVGVSFPAGGIDGHAWGVAGVGTARGSLTGFARGGEFGALAGNGAADPLGNYTQVYGLSVHAEGAIAGQYPTGAINIASTVAGANPQNIIVLEDSSINPVKSDGNVMVTSFTGTGVGSPHLAAANGINFLNANFTGYPFVYGPHGTPVWSVNKDGDMLVHDLIVSGTINQSTGIQILGQSAVAVPLTGTTAESIVGTINVPAGSMGLNGSIRVTAVLSFTGSANLKQSIVRFGSGLSGTIFAGQGTISSSAQSMTIQGQWTNRNSATSQVGRSASQSNFGVNNSPPATGTVDTTLSQNVVITAQLANASETITLESYLVELIKP